MKRAIAWSLFCVVSMTVCSCAWATWKSFAAIGTNTGIGLPSCAQAAQLNIVCAYRSNQSALMVNHFNGSAWGSWTTLSGTVSSDPSCTSNGAGKVFCAATTPSGQMEVAIYDGTNWGSPTTVAGSLYSGPSCAQYTGGKVMCVARNATGGLAWSLYNGSSWSAFANLTLATLTYSQPSCTTDNNNGIVCAVYSTDYNTYVNRYAGGWKGFLNINGIAGGVPDCVPMNSGGKVACFAKAYNAGLYVSVFNGGSWSVTNWTGYGGLGGNSNDNAGCTSQAPGQLLCGAMAVTDNAMYADIYDGTTWSGYSKAGGTGLGTPACTALGTGQVVCVIKGANNRLLSSVGP